MAIIKIEMRPLKDVDEEAYIRDAVNKFVDRLNMGCGKIVEEYSCPKFIG